VSCGEDACCWEFCKQSSNFISEKLFQEKIICVESSMNLTIRASEIW
jgi:hypothetical protein